MVEQSGAGIEVGQKREDGTIYLGYHQGKDWFVTAEDAEDKNGKRLVMTFNKASEYEKSLEAHGHNDWELPYDNILSEMYQAKNKGAFDSTYDESGFQPDDLYWTSTLYPDNGPPGGGVAIFQPFFGRPSAGSGGTWSGRKKT